MHLKGAAVVLQRLDECLAAVLDSSLIRDSQPSLTPDELIPNLCFTANSVTVELLAASMRGGWTYLLPTAALLELQGSSNSLAISQTGVAASCH